jgi:hypothetical protein
MPLDASQIYNGAWRVLNGQVPYRDFWLPYATVPIIAQAVMFWALGMSWMSYVLQASLLNGLYAASLTWAGVRFGLALPIAGVCGLVAGLIAYPPMGAPHIDNHATIFCSSLMLLVLLGILSPTRRGVWWLFAPPLAILAFFSKQSPTVFVVLFCAVAIVITAWRQHTTRDLVIVVISCVVSLLIVALLFSYFDISWEKFRIETIESAYTIFKSRFNVASPDMNAIIALLINMSMLAMRCLRLLLGVHFFSLAGILTLIALAGAVWARTLETVILSIFAAASLGVCILFAALSNNQPGTGLALLALALLLDLAALVQILASCRVMYAVVVLPMLIAGNVQLGWTSTRYVNDFYDFDQENLRKSVEGSLISPQLANLRWAVPSQHPGAKTASEYREMLRALEGRSTPALIISDSVLEPLAGQKPVAPTLSWEEIASYPGIDSPARSEFDKQFKRALVDAKSDLVVMDGPRTWMGTTLDSFPWLRACIKTDQPSMIGRFSLMQLDLECVRSTL